MSLYREAGGTGRGALVAGVVALVIGLGVGYAIGHATTGEPTLEQSLTTLRSDLSPISNGLELLAVEYPQGVRNGQVIAQTEYEGSVASVERIQSTAAAYADELQALDPEGAGQLSDTLSELQRAVSSKAPPQEVDRLRTRAATELEQLLPPATAGIK